jgi:hypothetical protein
MNRKTRFFLIGSGLVVVIGLGTGLVASYTGQLEGLGLSRQTEFDYLPSDAAAIAYADVHDIMSSEFRQRVRQLIPTGAEKDKFLQETGIDIEQDIDTVVAGLSTSGEGAAQPLVLIRGRFDSSKVESLATAHGATVRDYRGRRLVVASGFDGHALGSTQGVGQEPGMAFLEPGLLALGRVDAIERAIDKVDQPGEQDKSALMGLVGDVRGTGNAWVVGRFDRLASNPNLPESVRSHLPGIEWVAVSADIGSGVRGFVRADAIDDQAGEQLRAVVTGALAAAKMFGGQDAKIEAALKAVQATGSGKTAQVSFVVGPELLDLMQQNMAGVAAPK